MSERKPYLSRSSNIVAACALLVSLLTAAWTFTEPYRTTTGPRVLLHSTDAARYVRMFGPSGEEQQTTEVGILRVKNVGDTVDQLVDVEWDTVGGESRPREAWLVVTGHRAGQQLERVDTTSLTRYRSDPIRGVANPSIPPGEVTEYAVYFVDRVRLAGDQEELAPRVALTFAHSPGLTARMNVTLSGVGF